MVSVWAEKIWLTTWEPSPRVGQKSILRTWNRPERRSKPISLDSSVLDFTHRLLWLIELRSFLERRVKRLICGPLKVWANSRSLRLIRQSIEEPEWSCTWRRTTKTSQIQSMWNRSSTSTLTSLTSPFQSMVKESTSWRPFGPETRRKSPNNNTTISTNSCSAQLTISISFISSLMCLWLSRLLSIFPRPMTKSSVFSLKRDA